MHTTYHTTHHDFHVNGARPIPKTMGASLRIQPDLHQFDKWTGPLDQNHTKKGPIHLPNPIVAPRDGPTARCTWRFHAHLVHLIITLYVYVYYVCACKRARAKGSNSIHNPHS